jgi:hypothetical protein
MTIALGIIAHDCSVFGADSEISADTEKLDQGKLHAVIRPSQFGPGSICITGAGDVPYLRVLQQEIGDLFTDKPTESMDELEEVIAGFLKSFYKDHVIALSPHPAERPDVQLIIAARQGLFSRMWITQRNRLVRVSDPPFAATGYGANYAESLLRFSVIRQDEDTAMLIAAYVIFLVKDRVPSCGKDTHVICIGSDPLKAKVFSGAKSRKLEEIFRTYRDVEARVLHRALGSDWDFCRVDRVCGDIETLRERLRAIVSS